jgi:hypothetical protein
MAAPDEHLQSGGFGRVHQMPEPFANLGPTSEHWGHQDRLSHNSIQTVVVGPPIPCRTAAICRSRSDAREASLNPASRALPLPSSSIRPAPGVASCNTLSRLPTLTMASPRTAMPPFSMSGCVPLWGVERRATFEGAASIQDASNLRLPTSHRSTLTFTALRFIGRDGEMLSVKW